MMKNLVSAFKLALFTALAMNLTILKNADAQDSSPQYGARLEGFSYPQEVHQFAFTSQGEKLEMAYMDYKPEVPNGHTVVLLHGKNFCAATWDDTSEALVKAGFRVIAPDQIGFCKSTKPQHYQYTFQQLAHNTNNLLQSLRIDKATIIGHSTGGMLAIRYSLMFPQYVDKVVLVNPIGLEDWKVKGVPSISVDDWYQRELKVNAQSIKKYELSTYYAGSWKP